MKRRMFFRAAAWSLLLGLTLCQAALAAAPAAISPRYEAVQGFSEGLAAVCQNGRWGYVDTAGRTVIPPTYARAYPFSEGLAVVAEAAPVADPDGPGTAPGYVWYAVDAAGQRRALTYPGYVDSADGAVLTELPASIPQRLFDAAAVGTVRYIESYVNLRGCVNVDASMNLVFDRAGRWTALGGYCATGARGEGLFPAAVAPTAETLYVDAQGTPALWFEDGRLHTLRGFHGNLALHGVRAAEGDATLWGWIDRSGAWVIPPQYTAVAELDGRSFFGGLAAVRDDSGRWGAIDRAGRTVVPFQYEALGVFSEGLAAARRDGGCGVIDGKNRTAAPFVYDRLSAYSGGLAVAERDGRVVCIDRRGEEIAGTPENLCFPEDGLPAAWMATAQGGRYGFARLDYTPPAPMPEEMAAWAYDEAAAAIARGLVPADLQNLYDQEMTRGEFAAVAARLLAEGDAAGSLQGRGDGTLDPDAPITRQEAAALLHRVGTRLGKAASAGAAFADAADTAAYAREAVDYVSALGVMNGFPDGTFRPHAGLTRQQAYLSVWRLYRAARAEETDI